MFAPEQRAQIRAQQEQESINRIAEEIMAVINDVGEDLQYLQSSSGLLRLGKYKGVYYMTGHQDSPMLRKKAEQVKSIVKEKMGIDIDLAK